MNRWLRTIRHFPPEALWRRLYLKAAKKFYRPPKAPETLAQEWRQLQAETGWQLSSNDDTIRASAFPIIEEGQAVILNEPFPLPQSELDRLLASKTPLWRENYVYLEFLLPYLQNGPIEKNREFIERQIGLFWQLDAHHRNWSLYGVSRRVLLYGRLTSQVHLFSTEFQQTFWAQFYQDACYVAAFPETDIRGNHLVKDLKALLATSLIFRRLPSTRKQAGRWLFSLNKHLPETFASQVLPDGFHYERTPMYHAWVLEDLLDCLHWLKSEHIEFPVASLRNTGKRMRDALIAIRHSSGQLPLFGDTSLPQTPEPDSLLAYAETVLEESNPDPGTDLLAHLPDAGFTVFRHPRPDASLIVDCGDFGPRRLPAHSHADIGSFELHVQNQPILVDSGISDYAPGAERDYFRSSAAHNTIWVPGADQAELWGSFRVAEYPAFETCEVQADGSGAKVELAYENYNHAYRHQRSIFSVGGRFWVVQDWLTHLSPADRECYSLLHIHPDCSMQYNDEIFTVDDALLIMPFGMRELHWSGESPWRDHPNLYSAGFSLARPGQLIALSPRLPDCFGWVLVPFEASNRPKCQKLGEGVDLHFEDAAYRISWDSAGLHAAFREPAP